MKRAIPAAITYSQSGILFISHGATNPLLTALGTHVMDGFEKLVELVGSEFEDLGERPA